MRKWLVFSLIAVLLLSVGSAAYAQLNVTTQLGYGSTNYSALFANEKPKISEWSLLVAGSYAMDDLLFTGLYNGSYPLSFAFDGEEGESGNHRRTLLQVGGAYRLMVDTGLEVYAGLGYKYQSLTGKHSNWRDNKPFTFNGHGFVGQGIANIEIMESLHVNAVVTGSPWISWEYEESNNSDKKLPGSAFNYQLGLTYDITTDYAVHVGLNGGSYSIDEFTRAAGNNEKISKTNGGFTGVSLGVVWHF